MATTPKTRQQRQHALTPIPKPFDAAAEDRKFDRMLKRLAGNMVRDDPEMAKLFDLLK